MLDLRSKLRNLDGAELVLGSGGWGLEWQEVRPKRSDQAIPRGLLLVHITVFIVNKPESVLKMYPEYLIEWVISICDLQLKVYRSFIHHIIQIDSL